MLSRVKNLSILMLLVLLAEGCKKSNTLPLAPPPNDLIETTPPFQKPYTININQYIGGYYEALPAHYAVTTKKYPLLIFLHGGGQVGDGDTALPLLLNDGVAKEINEQKFPANFNVDGNNFSFIVLSPQFRAYPPDSMVYSFVDFALKKYRVDSARIYLSGLSMGGVLTTEMAGLYTSLLAAVVPIAGESFGTDKTFNAENVAHGGLALWDFHNSDDPTIPSNTATDFISLVNSFNPVIAPRLTIFQAYGHDAWSQALDPTYKENNMNVYEWMLQYKR
jgi:predicted peptidase